VPSNRLTLKVGIVREREGMDTDTLNFRTHSQIQQ